MAQQFAPEMHRRHAGSEIHYLTGQLATKNIVFFNTGTVIESRKPFVVRHRKQIGNGYDRQRAETSRKPCHQREKGVKHHLHFHGPKRRIHRIDRVVGKHSRKIGREKVKKRKIGGKVFPKAGRNVIIVQRQRGKRRKTECTCHNHQSVWRKEFPESAKIKRRCLRVHHESLVSEHSAENEENTYYGVPLYGNKKIMLKEYASVETDK